MKKRLRLISAITAAVMALSAMPAMAEETENLKTVELTPDNVVYGRNYEAPVSPQDKHIKLHVNSIEKIEAYMNFSFAGFENIPNVDAITGIEFESTHGVEVTRQNGKFWYATELPEQMPEDGDYIALEKNEENKYKVKDSEAVKTVIPFFEYVSTYTDQTKSWALSDEAYDKLREYIGSSGTVSLSSDKKLVINHTDEKNNCGYLFNFSFNEDGTHSMPVENLTATNEQVTQTIRFKLTDKVANSGVTVIEALQAAEKEDGSADLAFIMHGGANINNNFKTSKLYVTYDMTKVEEAFAAEIKAASTKEAVKSAAEKYNNFIGADLSVLSNMDYVYADIAETAAETDYTLETFKTAIENGAKVYLKVFTYSPDNYAAWNRYDDQFVKGLLINNNIIKRANGQIAAQYAVDLRLWEYLAAFDINNADAVTDLDFNTTFGKAAAHDITYFATPVKEFPVSTEQAFYAADSAECNTLAPYFRNNKVTLITGESNKSVSIDYSSKIEAIRETAGDSNSAILLAGVGSVTTTGEKYLKLFEDTLSVTYDMTKINDKYNADFAAIESAADVKALIENYSDFTGADAGILKNMDIVYNGLFDKISNGSVYTLDTLKTAIEEIASDYIYTVEYDKPTDYYMYKYANGNEGGLAGKLMLVNTTCVQFSDTGSTNYGQYAVKKFNSNHMDSYYYAPMLSYDIYNPQAVTDVKFTTNARRRSLSDGENPTYVAWNVSDAALTDAVPGEYKAGDAAFDTLSAWFDANRYTNQTEYSIPTPAEYDTDSATTHITTMDIPKFVMNSLTQKTGTPKLTITFSQNERHYTSGIDNNKLAITYDLSAVSEAEREYIIKGYEKYTTSEDKTALVDDGARVEIVQMKKDVPAASKAIIAAYNGGFLVKTAIADVTAPGFMKKTVLDLTGFADVTYDELKVMTWNGFTTMKPLATEFKLR